MTDAALSLAFPPALVEAIARAVADEIERRGTTANGATSSPWLTLTEAADYLRCERQRLYDLAANGALVPYKDGRRSLYRREALDAYLTAPNTGDPK